MMRQKPFWMQPDRSASSHQLWSRLGIFAYHHPIVHETRQDLAERFGPGPLANLSFHKATLHGSSYQEQLICQLLLDLCMQHLVIQPKIFRPSYSGSQQHPRTRVWAGRDQQCKLWLNLEASHPTSFERMLASALRGEQICTVNIHNLAATLYLPVLDRLAG
ncbi:hypothetical protein DSO57_1002913 [Entomophthora muscae]|uniref:Uncharacterized protein n=1 Tax=Entomophthora muscae TaxID=34485 RepID=A0ACC2SLN2_9FUNG|nr:hypothetical protein DSO57_1002913 [Entomophthora muscae]